MTAVHCLVRGMVQGVGFRYSALTRARGLGLAGWVRNNPDGSVETRAVGDDNALESYVDWLHRGPGYSRVDAVDIFYRGEIRESDRDLLKRGDFEVSF